MPSADDLCHGPVWAVLLGCCLAVPSVHKSAAAAAPREPWTAEESLELAQSRRSTREPSEYTRLMRQAKTLVYKGNYQEAIPLLKRALAIREEVLGPNHPKTAWSLITLAQTYHQQSLYGEAEPLYGRALAIYMKNPGPKHPNTAESLSLLANLYTNQGRYEEAEPLHRRALVIFENTRGPQHPDMARSLGRLAGLYTVQGRYGAAEPLYKRALAIYEKTLDTHPISLVNILKNLAQLYILQGRSDEGEYYYLLSLKIIEKYEPRHPGIADGLNGLARVYQDQGRYEEAEPLYRRALAILESTLGPNHSRTASQFNSLATLYTEQGRHEVAEPLYKRALEIDEKTLGLHHVSTATTLSNLSSNYSAQGRYRVAEPLRKRALAIMDKALGPEHPRTAISLSNLAWLYLVQSQYLEARQLQSRLNQTQAAWLRRELPLQPQELRWRLLAEQPSSVSTTFALLERDPGAADLAMEMRLNRQGLLAEIERRQRLLATSSPQTRSLSERIAGLDRQLASIGLPEERRAGLRQERRRLEADLYRLLPELRIEPVSTAQVAAALRSVAARGLLVEFQKYRPYQPDKQGKQDWGEWRYMALLLRPDGAIASVPLGEAAPIDAAISRALSATADNLADAANLWGDVTRLVFEPLQRQLAGSEELFLSPDGDLHRIPFAALPAPGQSGRLLSETVRLRILTTGRDLVRLQQPQRSGAGTAVVMADPDYNARGRSSTPRIAGGRGEPQRRSADLEGIAPWKPLPASAEEARQLAPLLQVQRPITGAEATAARALQQKAPRIFHIATHGYFEADQPEPPERPGGTGEGRAAAGSAGSPRREDPMLRSGLVFAGANQPAADPTDDGYLTAAEATGMDLEGTELVTLSACETGLGRVRSGEGVYGLQRALTVAGARSTLLSLWKVDDAATAAFMVEYYQRLRAGEGRMAALANTQAAFRKHANPLYRDLYVWGAFQLTGDWRPIKGI